MTFFCRNAQEEALKEIAKQMRIANEFDIIRELRNSGAMSNEQYIELLKKLEKGV